MVLALLRARLAAVHVDKINANVLTAKSDDDSAQRLCSTTISTDDATEIFWMHTNFKRAATTTIAISHCDIIGIIDDALD
jgi:hypothetical protein